MVARGGLAKCEASIFSRSKDFDAVTKNGRELSEVTRKLAALQQLATNRFLNGTMLNAMQQMTIDNVQLIRLHADQRFELDAGTPKKPASVTERMSLVLDARDDSANPGDQISRLKQAIGANAYFQTVLGRTNAVRLNSFQAPQMGSDGKPFVPFTLECRFADKTR
jgi:hypothetical protein